ncbi:hypothetical protein AX17_000620 [Amanita inopinata Kibby_2008]|nr:hypothetical protein AX17_000620 [Amanita inopinata Kibby_2008]
MSLLNHKIYPPPLRELQVFPNESNKNFVPAHVAGPEVEDYVGPGRKSPAAAFGGQNIGAVVLPYQLIKSINQLIQDSDKAQLHVDAKRLFLNEDAKGDTESGWDSQYNVRYRSRSQAARHIERDGTAFVSVAFPAHYSAIVAVLDHAKKRLGPSWSVQTVLDWGAGAGSGLWASVFSFQDPKSENPLANIEDFRPSDSTITKYIAIDKRDGLVTAGKRLVSAIDCDKLQIHWQRSFRRNDHLETFEAGQTLALSAFMLSSLPTSVGRKALVKEMWESGADVMVVLIDHSTTTGFEAIAEAREYLLKLGRRGLEDMEGEDPTKGSISQSSHVVAPCPHDGACPLRYAGNSRLTCGFSQRIQRPDFVRRTKHSKVGHEDIQYSYVVIRRGPRPSVATTQVGRVGEVGFRELQKDAEKRLPIKELVLHDDSGEVVKSNPDSTPEMAALPALSLKELQDQEELEAILRHEAYSWPRLVFPPLKRSGHVILDGCTAEGKIMRMIIPRSQGKQPFYDARKSNWGDIFPHPPKKPGQQRHPVLKGNANNGSVSEHKSDARRQSSGDGATTTLLREHRRKPRRRQLNDLLSQSE